PTSTARRTSTGRTSTSSPASTAASRRRRARPSPSPRRPATSTSSPPRAASGCPPDRSHDPSRARLLSHGRRALAVLRHDGRMALQLLAAPSDPALLDLPWDTPLEEWPADQLVALPRGLSRHVVRFVRLGEAVFAVKEIAEKAALRE